MNKRIYYILFPILAMLFSIADSHVGIEYNIASGTKASSIPGIANFSAAHAHPFSSNLKKQEHKVNINAIRIKAKHDAIAISILTYWELGVPFIYYTKSYCSSHNSYELNAHLPCYNLRGPPSLI